MTFGQIKYQIKFLIAYDLEGVLEIIKESLRFDSIALNEFILHLSKYNDLSHEIRLGIIDRESKKIEMTQIRYVIIELIDNLTQKDINTSTILEKLSSNEKYKGIITFSTWQEYNPNRTFTGNSFENFDFKINILPWFFNGQKIEEGDLNPIISAINLSESIFDLQITKFKLFENGMKVSAEHFNRFLGPIENLRTQIGKETNWIFFPVKNGDKMNADVMNELVSNLNEILEIGIMSKSK